MCIKLGFTYPSSVSTAQSIEGSNMKGSIVWSLVLFTFFFQGEAKIYLVETEEREIERSSFSENKNRALSPATALADPIFNNNDSTLFEGDIRLPPVSQGGSFWNMMKNKEWRYGIVPIEISHEFTNKERCTIKKALNELNQKTCVKVVPRNGERNYVYIKKGTGCWAYVGREGQGRGRQDMSLGDYCVTRNTLVLLCILTV